MRKRSHFSLRVEDGKHRQATWLELFFDLAFVTCIGALSHTLIAEPNGFGVLRYLALFVPVWWVWNQFTWYASHFDNDDLWFRLFMLGGAGGTLALKGGIASWHEGSTHFITAYLGLHAILALGWIRAYQHIANYHSYIRFKLTGIGLGMIFWFAALLMPERAALLMGAGILLQLAMPILAWKTVRKFISVHVHHLLERHGLFTIIVLGESLLALSTHAGHTTIDTLPQVSAVYIALVSLWWVYFDWGYDPINLNATTRAFAYNYGQLLVYVALGIFAAGGGLMLIDPATSGSFIASGTLMFLLSLCGMNLFSGREGWTRRTKLRLLASAALLALMILQPLMLWSPTVLVMATAAIMLVLLGAQSRVVV